MVVFTCSYCGESVKKNQVEKHYSFICRSRSPALTCVDCLKDFMDQEYVAHTSCVTEAERYSAKGFVSKPPSDKGKKKQEKWMNSISNILESGKELEPDVRLLIQHLIQDGAAPQKKLKFMNYCNNKFRGKLQYNVFERVWQLLEKILDEMKNNKSNNNDDSCENGVNQEERKRKRVDSNAECPNNESGDSEKKPVENGNCGVAKMQKKHKKNKKNSETESEVVPVTEEKAGGKKDKSKKSKKDKRNIENGNHTEENVEVGSDGIQECEDLECKEDDGKESQIEESNEHQQLITLTKKEKKQKRKQEKYEKQLMEMQSEASEKLLEDNEENKVEETIKKKKKKKQIQSTGGGCASETTEPLANGETKHKKKKHLESLPEEIAADGEKVEILKPSKFNWEEIIIKVLETKGELPLKRLEKKIVNEYISSCEHVKSIEEVIAKFNKKVMKIPRVKVKKEVAKLVP